MKIARVAPNKPFVILLVRYMNSRKIKRVVGAGLLALLFFFIVAWQQVSYPRVWNEVQLGMTRQDVYHRVGSPDQDSGEIKGAFWIKEKLTGRQELWLYFENDKVAMLSIKRYVGTRHTYKVQLVRFENTSPR